MEKAYLDTAIGIIEITGERNTIFTVGFVDEKLEDSFHDSGMVAKAREQLQEYFDGKREEFDLMLTPYGTPFQRRVWDALQQIPHGKTISYLELSRKLGDALAIRAVASANGKNPIAIIIPCHRVIGSDGSLTGYAGGLHRKRFLINLESPVHQTTLF
ncbi:MAG: methylated-DNA--[protein]-cysteine S-methyltransferase [Flavobacteriaceae bacterium]|nr:methylated-DNA--[protein]-cysteine S-methyltransferase [Flavobacteriaceae bacterium]